MIVILLIKLLFLPIAYNERLPEYREYLLRKMTTPNSSTQQMLTLQSQKQIQAPFPLSNIHLCKEIPAPGDYYGQIFCWGMTVLFALTVLTLIIYQLRSILWLKLTITQQQEERKRKKNKKENNFGQLAMQMMPFGNNEQHTDNQHLD